MRDSDTNVVSLLATAAEHWPDRQAIVVGRTNSQSTNQSIRITFAELWRRVDRVGCGLAGLGVRTGDRVVIMIPMSIDLYVALLAVLKLGAVGVFVDPWIGRRQIAAFAAYAEPAAFIGIGKSHLLRLTDKKLRRIPIAVTTGRSYLGLPAKHRLNHLLRRAGDGVMTPVEADDPALVTFTTGSSGEPKGANRTHAYLLAQHAALQMEFPYNDQDVDLTMFPVFALNNLANGITTVVPGIDFRQVAESDGTAILWQLQAESVTTITASPPLVDRLHRALQFQPVPCTLRRILVGGAPVRDDQLRDWQQSLPGVEIVVVYGSTEVEPVAHIDAHERLNLSSDVHPVTPGFCTGVPTKLLDTKIVRMVDKPIVLDGRGWLEWEAGPGEIGELVVSGDHVGKEYFRNPNATDANKIRDHNGRTWHRMGDTGYFDNHGRFWLTGRVHSTIRRRQQLIHPQLVEQAAMGAGVVRVAALGIEDDQLGQRLAVVVETAEHDIEFARTVSQRLGQRGIEADELILTSKPLPVDARHNSKIDYRRLRMIIHTAKHGRQWSHWSANQLRAEAAEVPS